jgi:hypothetical protein
MPPPTEEELQLMVCDYVASLWPGVIFNSDLAGQHTGPAQAGKNTRMRSGAGFPDWFLAEPRGGYHGLFLELKREGTKLHKKDGSWATPHIRQQAEVLTKLDEAGYQAWFGVGWDQCRAIVDEYMALPILV